MIVRKLIFFCMCLLITSSVLGNPLDPTEKFKNIADGTLAFATATEKLIQICEKFNCVSLFKNKSKLEFLNNYNFIQYLESSCIFTLKEKKSLDQQFKILRTDFSYNEFNDSFSSTFSYAKLGLFEKWINIKNKDETKDSVNTSCIVKTKSNGEIEEINLK